MSNWRPCYFWCYLCCLLLLPPTTKHKNFFSEFWNYQIKSKWFCVILKKNSFLLITFAGQHRISHLISRSKFGLITFVNDGSGYILPEIQGFGISILKWVESKVRGALHFEKSSNMAKMWLKICQKMKKMKVHVALNPVFRWFQVPDLSLMHTL